MTKLTLLLLFCLSLVMSGCSRNIFSIHKIDIEQGNLLNSAAVAEISPGMTKKQVVALLGKPVLTPVLNPDRWDYVYYLKRPDEPAENNRVTIYFAHDKVTHVEKKE